MDEIDRAKQEEIADRDRALQAQQERATITEQPLILNGVRHCIDCLDPICPGRLAVHPNAVRCLSCQEDYERYEV